MCGSDGRVTHLDLPEFGQSYLRLGKPWAVAGLQPEDYGYPNDEHIARFWRWAVHQEASDPLIEDFIADTVELLYGGADLRRLKLAIEGGCSEAREIYDHLRRQFGCGTT